MSGFQTDNVKTREWKLRFDLAALKEPSVMCEVGKGGESVVVTSRDSV